MTSPNDASALRALVADKVRLADALKAADIVPLLLVYTHLSGDETMLERFRPLIKGAWSFEVESDEKLEAELREKLIATLELFATNGRPLPPAPDKARLQHMCDVAVGQPVPPEYLPMVLEELNFDQTDAKTVRWRKPVSQAALEKYHVLVIGAGYSGLAMAIKLKEFGDSLHGYRKERPGRRHLVRKLLSRRRGRYPQPLLFLQLPHFVGLGSLFRAGPGDHQIHPHGLCRIRGQGAHPLRGRGGFGGVECG